MKLKTELVFAEMGDGIVAVPVGNDARRIVVRLNETGADICKDIIDGYTEEQIAARLLAKYSDIDESKAHDAVRSVIDKLVREDLLQK